MRSNHRRLQQLGFATLVLALSAGVAVFPPTAGTAPPQSADAEARGVQEAYDLALSLSLSRKVVPFGGTVREVLRVTNRGTTREQRRLAFGQEINRPGAPHDPGKAVYAFVRSPGGDCSKGTYGPTSKIQTFACLLTPLDPGESQTVVIKIKNVKGSLLLDAKGFYGQSGRVYDDSRTNDTVQTIVRVRR